MRISRYLSPNNVLLGLEAQGKKDLIRVIASRLGEGDASLDPGQIERNILRREEAHSTVLGGGVALPHATVDGVGDPLLLIALAEIPVQYGPPGTDPVDVFFVLLSPPAREQDHIKLLARICRLVRDPRLLPSLKEATGAEEVVNAVREIDEQHV